MIQKIGILGLFDPAAKIGLNNYEKEDWGQTLATWGAGEGWYIVLPILGPSTLRDTLGSLTTYVGGDALYNITVRNDTQYVSDFDYYASLNLGRIKVVGANFYTSYLYNNLD